MATESKTARSPVEGENLRAAIRTILRNHLDLNHYRVFLFGSECTGTAVRGSDIDIGIMGDGRVAGRIMDRIRQELDELRTLRRFDVIDLCCTDESFRSAALKHAKRL